MPLEVILMLKTTVVNSQSSGGMYVPEFRQNVSLANTARPSQFRKLTNKGTAVTGGEIILNYRARASSSVVARSHRCLNLEDLKWNLNRGITDRVISLRYW